MPSERDKPSENPYETPRERSQMPTVSAPRNASVLWFIGTVFVATFVGLFMPRPLIVRSEVYVSPSNVFFAALYSAMTTGSALLVCGTIAVIFKRSYAATRLSRSVAGFVFAALMSLGEWLIIVFGFGVPVVVFWLPAGALSTFADRFLAKLSRRP